MFIPRRISRELFCRQLAVWVSVNFTFSLTWLTLENDIAWIDKSRLELLFSFKSVLKFV